MNEAAKVMSLEIVNQPEPKPFLAVQSHSEMQETQDILSVTPPPELLKPNLIESPVFAKITK